ncbi:hypothetical protein FJT64_021207 [Amphibalanus amphitrite]|uniref:WAP domain-containing protein n=1 Tax=Amphibalanus amphitrite TaxID=1232801 RepID=A0A6A4WUH5_AMPAM|nr:hypothetical protein FJT64_021207 [Amphibalanus amphitrite]
MVGRPSMALLLMLWAATMAVALPNNGATNVIPGCNPLGYTIGSTCEYTQCVHCIRNEDCCKTGQICCPWGCGKRCTDPYDW